MAEEKLLTVRDVSIILGITEKEVIELAENGAIPAYKVGGIYLRFKREQVQQYNKSRKPVSAKLDLEKEYPIQDRVSDFFYFNDFYILAAAIVFLLLFIILKGY
jgi:excisionase family DNA binding protein